MLNARYEGFFSFHAAELNWDIVSLSKESKLIFIDKLIRVIRGITTHVSSHISASAVITGTQAEQTNLFLQQMCIVIYSFSKTSERHLEDSFDISTSRLHVDFSKDGVDFHGKRSAELSINDITIDLLHHDTSNTNCVRMQIEPLDKKIICARFSLSIDYTCAPQPETYSTSEIINNNLLTDEFISCLDMMLKLSHVLTTSLELIRKHEEQKQIIVQNEIKKVTTRKTKYSLK